MVSDGEARTTRLHRPLPVPGGSPAPGQGGQLRRGAEGTGDVVVPASCGYLVAEECRGTAISRALQSPDGW